MALSWEKVNTPTLPPAKPLSNMSPVSKVIIEKSRGEVSLMGQDTIENVSEPTKNKNIFLNFLRFFFNFI